MTPRTVTRGSADYWRHLAAEAQEEAAKASALARRRLDVGYLPYIVRADQAHVAGLYQAARMRLDFAERGLSPTGRHPR